MKKEQFHKEILYHASLSPFKSMLENGIISVDDFRVIDTILRVKYSPIFVAVTYQIQLDNNQE